jgi:hypothetical protein
VRNQGGAVVGHVPAPTHVNKLGAGYRGQARVPGGVWVGVQKRPVLDLKGVRNKDDAHTHTATASNSDNWTPSAACHAKHIRG